MIVGVPRETYPGERRVALVPAAIPSLLKAGLEVVVEAGAGMAAGYRDEDYVSKGAKLLPGRAELFRIAGVITQVLAVGANDTTGEADLPLLRPDQDLIGCLRPYGKVETLQQLAATGVTSFSIELMPRTTRAQSMDALSSMATICGYKAVVIAADTLPRLFPMLTTAAGTITPARVLVLGAGVAGLQAIATARRLGQRRAARATYGGCGAMGNACDPWSNRPLRAAGMRWHRCAPPPLGPARGLLAVRTALG